MFNLGLLGDSEGWLLCRRRTAAALAIFAAMVQGILAASAVLAIAQPAAAQPAAASTGWRQARIVSMPGCNADAFAQLPGSPELFLGRVLLNADGQVTPGFPKNDCSGGKNNQWALTLDRFDWASARMTTTKVILDTSLDTATQLRRTVITGGSQKGLQIQSAYDPSVVSYKGLTLVSFECIPLHGTPFGITATSSCIGVFDPNTRKIDLARTKVIVSGHAYPDRYVAAAVPKLLVYRGALYVYWSSLAVNQNPHKFLSLVIRGAELRLDPDGEVVPVAGGKFLHSDDSVAPAVWSPTPGDPRSDTTVDIRQLWSKGDAIYATAGVGGSGCAAPLDGQPGCFRLVIARADRPLGEQIFKPLTNVALPTNPQEYSYIARSPQGGTFMLGGFFRPKADGVTDADPAPSKEVWSHLGGGPGAVDLIMFPIDLDVIEK